MLSPMAGCEPILKIRVPELVNGPCLAQHLPLPCVFEQSPEPHYTPHPQKKSDFCEEQERCGEIYEPGSEPTKDTEEEPCQ